MTHYQLVIVKFMERRVKLSFPVGYVKGIIPFTFFPIWMKPKKCWIIVLLLRSDFHLPSLVDKVTDPNQPSVEPTLSECESHKSIPDPSQVEEIVDPISPLVNHTFPIESEYDSTQVLFISSASNELGGNPLVPSIHEENPPILVTQGGNSPLLTVPPPSSLVTSLD